MNRPPPHGRGQPRGGATYYPGGSDDYHMPEVISPSPQRVMPEVPENMQDNIAHLEREARSPRSPHFPERSSSFNHDGSHAVSPFPVLRNPPPNVPPTDEQKEANLEKGRLAVLSSNDPEMQLAWAQDALSYVEVAMQNEARMSLVQPPRPQTPRIERQLRTDAMNIVSFLAEQHHPRAEFIKGMWLEFGKFGYPVDKKEAFRCYARAAEKGYARAEYRMGMQFESSNEPAKAIRHYEKGVAMKDSASYYRLGMMILLGQHGQRQDYQKGLEYIRLAAQTCDENAPQGAYVYGMLLARELPQVTVPDQYLPVDINAARVNIEKAAYHGFAKAQVKMGAAYELCQLGCDFNPALSLHYNVLAARQGEPEAEMAISKWFLCGHEGLFEKNDEIAFTYAQRAAQSGLPTAEFALGYFYEVGIHVPVDIKEARSWYAKAAASGNKDAASRIDSISRSKTLSRKDHENVAIARIKSTRGTNGRNRSSWEPNPSMEPPQEVLEMPDPSRMRISDDGPGYHPTSAAPYPDGRPSTANQWPDSRPSSAFGVNPNIHPGSPGYGTGAPPSHRVPSGGAPPMSPRQPSSGMQSPKRSPGGGHANGSQGVPKLDIGYSAPLESDRRQQPGTGRPPQDMGRAPPPGQQPGRPSPGPYPPRNESMPPSSRPSTASSTPKPSGPANNAPSNPSKPAALPGKGPKTFEEMGVPVVKQESECILM
ncbi:hypothetical protein VTN77DRAFT_9157 [Rasamsonia byssochlamydoides]|uniref:uncharacterized protein n=1 Tax=Rasamsonia byssochlamydoides TaxID=89139 RepID=UPI0037439B7B